MTRASFFGRLNLRSVYAKCLMIALATALVVAGAISVLGFRTASNVAEDGVAEFGLRMTTQFANGIGGAMRFGKVADIEAQAAQLIAGSGQKAITLVVMDRDGNTLVSRQVGEESDTAALTDVTGEALQGGSRAFGNDGLLVALPIIVGDAAEQIGAVGIEWSVAPIRPLIWQNQLEALVVSAVILGLMLCLAAVLLRKFLGKPLQALEQSVSGVAAGDYVTEINGRARRDEIGRLAGHLDQMRAGLAEGDAASRAQRRDQEEQAVVLSVLTRALQGISAGDLTVRIDEAFSDSYAGLRRDFNETVTSLHDAMQMLAENAQVIQSEAEGIGQQAADLSHRTENQAATLEETAAAIDQLTSGVKAAADSARDAEVIVQTAKTEAHKSNDVVRQTVTAMSEIEKSSEQIAKIISVIDDIAFQTNLLALNAGVEAARAGEAGRGFAVVASEVRALAQRSSEAAQEIKGLISSSGEQVERGVQLVGATGTALAAITERVVEISSLMSGIAQSAEEQSRSLGEINIGVGQLDKVTQQNAAMVDAANTATQTLRKEAQALGGLVSRFTISRAQATRSYRAA